MNTQDNQGRRGSDMLARLKARKAEIGRLREERGPSDPVLVVAGVKVNLILLVGGSFAISGFIGNATPTNLHRVATAQASYLALKPLADATLLHSAACAEY